jgi:hypothetical protein
MLSGDLSPYGKWAVSPKYMNDSWGKRLFIALATVSPPIPESKIPIGRSEDFIEAKKKKSRHNRRDF